MRIEQAEFIAELVGMYKKSLKNHDIHYRNYKQVNDRFGKAVMEYTANPSEDTHFDAVICKSNRDLFIGYSSASWSRVTEMQKIIKGIDTIWP